VFYPESIHTNQRLAFYAHHFNTVEIDSTFYAPPSTQTARNWLEVTPDDFRFSVKLPREITHVNKLRGCEELLRGFLVSIEPLRPKLSCALVQLPPHFTLKHDELALREFIHALPGDCRFAVEFRDPSWHLPRIAHLLEQHHVCWVWNDITPLDHQAEGAFEFFPRTTDFLYVRLLGDLATKYRGDGSRVFKYREPMWDRQSALESWAVRIRQYADEVARVLIYANNHFEGYSPVTCQRMGQRLGLQIHLPELQAATSHSPEQAQLDLF
jgi:uncharacterized protein YecE (DUF72 family)